MKVTIVDEKGESRTYPIDLDFTFEEADVVKEVTKLRMGELLAELSRGDVMASLAFAVVAKMRAEPGFDPWSMRKAPIDSIEIDLSDDVEAAERPPAVPALAGDEKPSGPES